jgi:hypothetical protein
MRRGEQLIYIFYVLAALSAAAIAAEFAAPKAAVPVTIATLILALVSLGVGVPTRAVAFDTKNFGSRPGLSPI